MGPVYDMGLLNILKIYSLILKIFNVKMDF